jgi:hypothetical protein
LRVPAERDRVFAAARERFAGLHILVNTMSREGRAPRLVEPDEMVPPLLYVVSREADTVNGWRFDANFWDPSLPPAEAARRAGFEMHASRTKETSGWFRP